MGGFIKEEVKDVFFPGSESGCVYGAGRYDRGADFFQKFLRFLKKGGCLFIAGGFNSFGRLGTEFGQRGKGEQPIDYYFGFGPETVQLISDVGSGE